MAFEIGDHGELESANAVDQLLRNYDRASGEWSLEERGGFWEAVKIAHNAGRKGRGTLIAIMDGWYDETISHLRNRIRSQKVCSGASRASQAATEHGTAVSLLVGAVAPDANLDFYGICDSFGRPLPDSLSHALALAAESDASILNISAGRHRSWRASLEIHRGLPSGYGSLGIKDECVGQEDCAWCRPTDNAAARGKVIVAAVGNDHGVWCPARSPHVIATGFFVDHRSLSQELDGKTYEVGNAGEPKEYVQGSELGFIIEQPEDAIGSSFASPLLSGALALGVPSENIAYWLEARSIGSQAQLQLAKDNATPSDISELLTQAWSKVEHNHFAESNPVPCFECSLFLEALYTADSLHWLYLGKYDRARQRLRTVQRIMPWSPHAFVNLGQLLERVVAETADCVEASDLLAEALRQYEIALNCPSSSLIAKQRIAALRG